MILLLGESAEAGASAPHSTCESERERMLNLAGNRIIFPPNLGEINVPVHLLPSVVLAPVRWGACFLWERRMLRKRNECCSSKEWSASMKVQNGFILCLISCETCLVTVDGRFFFCLFLFDNQVRSKVFAFGCFITPQ